LASLGDSIAEGLQGFRPTLDQLSRAIRHVPPHIRGGLYDTRDFYRRRMALGHLYQSVVYDRIHYLCDQSSGVKSFVRLFGDVPRESMTEGELGQNGFFYTRNPEGEIVVRGNGADLGEIDSLVFGADGSVLFFEIKLSDRNLDELEEKVPYKRDLLKLLLSMDPGFLLVSPADTGSNREISRLLNDPRNKTVRTGDLGGLPPGLLTNTRRPEPHSRCKAILLSDIERVNAFDYAKAHDEIRLKLIERLDLPDPLGFQHKNFFLLRRLVLGALDPEAVSHILRTYRLSVDGTTIDDYVYRKRLSRTVMTLTLPEARPKLYLRARAKPNYLNLGPMPQNTFVFERNIVKARAPAFFRELESAKETIGSDVATKVLGRYIRPEVLESHRKFRDVPIW